MSMLGEQIKELHEMADAMHRRSREIGLDYGMGRELADASRILREAADTIDSMQDSLNEVAGRWAEAQIKAEDYALENMLLKIDNDTRWYELFGTPERAARTLANVCQFTHGGELCDRCQCYLFGDCDRTLRLMSERTIYDALLEWLKQEVDA